MATSESVFILINATLDDCVPFSIAHEAHGFETALAVKPSVDKLTTGHSATKVFKEPARMPSILPASASRNVLMAAGPVATAVVAPSHCSTPSSEKSAAMRSQRPNCASWNKRLCGVLYLAHGFDPFDISG